MKGEIMDLSSIFGTLFSSEGIGGISEKTGASSFDIKNVLSSALPQLLNGADKQNTDESTSSGFVNALSQHASNDTSNLSSFFGNVDLNDGAKIVGHLLGKDGSANVAAQTGVNSSNTSNILSSAAPLVMSLLGKQFSKEKRSMGSHFVDESDLETAKNAVPTEENILNKAVNAVNPAKKTVSGGVKAASQSKKAAIKAKTTGKGGAKPLTVKKNK